MTKRFCVGLVVAMLAGGCGGDDRGGDGGASDDGGGGGDYTEQYVSKLESCGLVTSGRVYFPEPTNDRQRCEAQCLLDASCASLTTLLCGSVIPSELQACTCEGEFACEDGSAVISELWRCDGRNDCGDGSDEVGCPPAPTFRCDDGTTIPYRDICDLEEHCPDGSDEVGCATLNCP